MTGEEAQPAGRPPLPALVLLAGLACFLIYNMANFFVLDSRVSDRYSALHRYHTGDMLEVWLVTVSSTPGVYRGRFAAGWMLGRHAPGSTIIVPDSGGPHSGPRFRNQMLSFGRAREVERRRYNQRRLAADIDFEPYIVAVGTSGERRNRRHYRLALSDRPSGTIIALRRGRQEIFADTALLPDGWEAGPD